MVELAAVMDSGQKRLHELGYKQELTRTLSAISSFALCLSVLSILLGVTALYNTGLTYGGTISFTWGWFICGFFNLLVGLAMAEICSAFPTSGGLYFWSSQMASPKWKPFAAWITGWYNVVGQWASTCSVSFAVSQMVQVMVLLGTGGTNGGGYLMNKYQMVATNAAILFSTGLLNCLPIGYLDYLGLFSAAWNFVGTFLLIVVIPAVATERQTFSFVFTSFHVPTDLNLPSRPYVFLLGLLMSQYAICGFDASAHMSEETKASDRNGPFGILAAIIVSIVLGYAYIMGITFAVMDPDMLLDPANDAGGYAIGQLFYQVFKDRYGTGTGGIFCMGIVAVAVYLCCMSCITSNSRMTYAFSRDGALPLSKLWHKVNRHEVPIYAVWLSAFMAFVMTLPSLGSLVAFQAMVSIATIGSYISYAIPIFIRITLAHRTFVPGPVNLGPRWRSLAVGWLAVIWVATITVLFCLPVRYPLDTESLNYTPAAVGGVFVLVMSYWLLSARKWFKGPQQNFNYVPSLPGTDSKIAYA
ncbi:hypothetical protein KC19_4G243800 [Ceratodon purpureus]|uniref:Uncharacterized protein n=1 Tax=Ceratodon purpureus TaxID=3225 RepID=A0A8T0ID56_CERPU|nr:hypothetical protein KC19_4G243800 [Ceratodon purpureus]